jgi:hypothetical protein
MIHIFLETLEFVLQERLINLNCDHWLPSFGKDISKITTLSENIYEIYSSNTENALNQIIKRLRFKEFLFSKEEQKFFNVMFNSIPLQKNNEKLLEEDEKIKKEQLTNKIVICILLTIIKNNKNIFIR